MQVGVEDMTCGAEGSEGVCVCGGGGRGGDRNNPGPMEINSLETERCSGGG